ncbi:hypothetical protein ABPG75_010442 [Micractinium tetrahymenae]
MGKRRVLSPNSVWDAAAVEEAFKAAGANTRHIPRMYNHLIRHPGSTWRDVPDLPKAAVAVLDAVFALHTTKLLGAQRSSDGETTKLLVQLQDGLQVEAVIMEYDNTERYAAAAAADQEQREQQQEQDAAHAQPPHAAEQRGQQQAQQGQQPKQQAGSDEDDFHDAMSSLGEVYSLQGGRRATLCVSSEVGCAMGCTFCATGTMGIIADLTAGEIVEQLVHASSVARIRNIVFMGMGEPLNNYSAVKAAVSMMTDPRAFGLRRKKVTVSTVGVVPRLLQLADDMPGVSLALSLHAPTQELRQTIVPSAKAFKLDRLMGAVDEYQRRTRQSVFIEYVMLGPDVNCTEEHAHQLGALLRGRDVLVNLIPWNPILSPSISFRAPAEGATAAFHRILRHQYGVNCTIRQEKGQDISGACGQLVLEHGGQAGASGGKGGCGGGKGGLTDVEDLLPPPAAPAATAAAR